MDFLLSIDKSILEFFSVTLKNPLFDAVMPFVTNLNNHGEIWICISILLMINKNTAIRRMGISMLIGVAFAYLTGEAGLKNIVERARPIGDEFNYEFLIPKPNSYSFPSGHTASSFAAFSVCMFSRWRHKYWVLALAVLIAFSRLYLHVHYPSDILGGIFIGIIGGKVGVYLENVFYSKRQTNTN